MLWPLDYARDALFNTVTRKLMERIEFAHGGPEYDSKYPEGIPTSVQIKTADKTFDSGLIMFPGGHARCQTVDRASVLAHKFSLMGSLAVCANLISVNTTCCVCYHPWDSMVLW